MKVHTTDEPDAIRGVGLREWGSDPLQHARRMRAIGGAMLALAIAGFVLAFVASAFGAAPLAVPVMLLLVPLAFGGSWLRKRGSAQIRSIDVKAARDEHAPAGV
jgi:hypothetical protein